MPTIELNEAWTLKQVQGDGYDSHLKQHALSPTLMRILVALLVLAAAPSLDGLRAMQALDARVANVAFRLASANVASCSRKEPLSGLVLHSLGQYADKDRKAAAQAFGFADSPVVLAVADGGPAARAGVRVGDHLLAVGNERMPEAVAGRADMAVVERARSALKRGLATDAVRLSLRRGTTEFEVSLKSVAGCASLIEMIPSRKRNALADGEVVQVTSATVAATRDNDELAFVIAHELAHNIKGHYDWLQANRRTKANIRKTEVEADSLGIMLMAKAGYDPQAAARFWNHFGGGLSGGILSDGTHMTKRDRVAFLRAAADRLAKSEAQ